MQKKLNKEQLQAIKHSNGPLLIIAGAGTGKTTVITERIKYLISKGLAKPEEILALTFTEKAATEMEQRVDEVMPLSYGDIWIMTFHSFCDRILRDEGLHIGLPSNYKLMTEGEQIDFFKKNLFEFSLDYFRPLGNPNKFISELLKHFSRLQDEVVNPSEYISWVKKVNAKKSNDKLNQEEELENKKWKELATVYKEYSDLKIKIGKFDFGDLIIKTIELFEKRPNILLKYQEKFKYILVDEFQDTNFAQNVLVNKLAQKYKNIATVGDDNQSVYRFRGAAISNIIQFKNTYPEAKIITLNKNYRSTQTILDSAYKVIKHNDPDTLEYQLGISKKLLSAVSLQSTAIKLIQTETGQEEAEEVSNSINQLISNSKYEYKDIAILVRANNHAEGFIREFERRGIPHQFLGPNKLLERNEIIDLISYLKALYNIEDSANLYRLFSSETLDISPLELIKLMTLAKRKSISFFEVLTESKNKKIIKILKLIDTHLKNINKLSAGEILYDYIKEVGIYEKVLENENEVAAQNISKFFEKIKNYENENPKAKLFEVVDYINILQEMGDMPTVSSGDWQEKMAVNILTVHSSKGLEFPVIFLVNLVSERFPSRERHEQIPIPNDLIKEVLPKGDFHLEEERRLFYVGMTRAKERLFLTAAKYYGDGKREKKISPFVMEALGETVNSQPSTVNSKIINTYSEKVNHSTQFTVHGSQTKISFLSVSQIETFKTCPMHFKLKYIYKIPTPMSASISFGITIHETLRQFFVGKKDILKIYENNFLQEGYENKKQKQLFFKKGENYLKGFLKNGFDPKVKTIELEKDFKLKIDKDLTLGGKIDRIDDLGKETYEVIDYKTGANIPTQKEVDKDLQLSVYSFAASQMFEVDPENIKLSLYFLDTQEKIITSRTTKQLEEVKQEILEIKKEIENSDFKCSDEYFCQQGCEFKMFCK